MKRGNSLTKDLTAYKSDLPKNRTGPAPETLLHMSQFINKMDKEKYKLKQIGKIKL